MFNQIIYLFLFKTVNISFLICSVRLLPVDVRFKSFTDTVNAFRVLVEIFCFVMC